MRLRWKLLRRQWSISAPRMIVRSHMPWPLRWAVLAAAFGFSAAMALWAFEFGKDIAGLDKGVTRAEFDRVTGELARVREERDKAQSIANTAESLLKMERTAQDRLAEQLKVLELENLSLQDDLGFFERLLPTSGSDRLSVRSLQVERLAPGQLRYQVLLMQNGRTEPEFRGRYEVALAGQLDGRPWTLAPRGGARELQFKHYKRVEGVIDYPAQAVIQQVHARVIDPAGGVRAQRSVKP